MATLSPETWTWTRTPTLTLLSDPSLTLSLSSGERTGVFFFPHVSAPITVRKLLTEFCLLRARPVINIKKEIEFSPKKIDLTKKNCGNFFWYVGQLFFPIESNQTYSL